VEKSEDKTLTATVNSKQ